MKFSFITSIRSKSLTLLILLFSLPVFAQKNTISPFSRLSIGDIQEPSFSQNFSMGGLSYALQSPNNINPYNPASYSKLFWTSFEAGVMTKNYWLKSGEQTENTNITNFNHLAMGFPIAPWWGFAFAIMPVSQVGYDYKTSGSFISTDSVDVTYNNAFTGEGGLNRVLLGNGFSIKRTFYFGFNFSYYFGDMEYQETLEYTLTDDYYNSAGVEKVKTGDVYFDFGAQYRVNVGNKWRMDVGAIFVPLQGLDSKKDELSFTYTDISGSPRLIDTISFSENDPFSIVLPPKYGLGVLLNRGEKWKAGVDVDYTAWSLSNYNTYNGLKDVYGLKAGFEYTGPDETYIFRSGIRYSPMALVFNDSRSEAMAATIGIAFPIRSKDKLSYTVINIGAEFGKRGKLSDQWLEEKYINVSVSLTLNNKWFIKRVYD